MVKFAVAAAVFAFSLRVGVAVAQPVGWVLATSWQPGFCAIHADAAECHSPVPPRLGLHGLWPQFGAGKADSCGHTVNEEGHAWCDLAAPEISEVTRRALLRVMPGAADCLDRHEWWRHGVCAGLSAEDYFARAIRLTDGSNGLPIAAFLRAERGSDVTLDALVAALAKSGSDPRSLIICRGWHGQFHVAEIEWWLSPDELDRDPAQRGLQSVRPGAKGCPAVGSIRVD